VATQITTVTVKFCMISFHIRGLNFISFRFLWDEVTKCKRIYIVPQLNTWCHQLLTASATPWPLPRRAINTTQRHRLPASRYALMSSATASARSKNCLTSVIAWWPYGKWRTISKRNFFFWGGGETNRTREQKIASGHLMARQQHLYYGLARPANCHFGTILNDLEWPLT